MNAACKVSTRLSAANPDTVVTPTFSPTRCHGRVICAA